MTEQYPTIEYRIYLPNTLPFEEHAIGLSQIAALYPQAVRVEVVDAAVPCVDCPVKGQFW